VEQKQGIRIKRLVSTIQERLEKSKWRSSNRSTGLLHDWDLPNAFVEIEFPGIYRERLKHSGLAHLQAGVLR